MATMSGIRGVSVAIARQTSFMRVGRCRRIQKIASIWALVLPGSATSAVDWAPGAAPNLFTHRTLSNDTVGDNHVMLVLKEFLARLGEPEVSCPASEKAHGFSSYSLQDLAFDLASQYLALAPIATTMTSATEKSRRVSILHFLATQCIPHQISVNEAIDKYRVESQQPYEHNNMVLLTAKLREACTPRYERLFQHVLEEDPARGLVFLVSLREDLLIVRQSGMVEDDDEAAQLKQLDVYLRELLSMWFSPRMLEIRRITYEGTSASVMETIATKEAVHPVQSLEDLRSRLGNDRRVFAAFHPLLPNEPLVFCHVALRCFVPSSMSQVLDMERGDASKDVHVATFYSISSTQPGLSGIDLGQFLLKQAISLLKAEFATLETCVTLSPIPRFRLWLKDKLLLNQMDEGTFVDESFLQKGDTALLAKVLGCSQADASATFLGTLDDPTAMMEEYGESLEPILMRLAARYLATEKHRRKPLDGVARFHIRNGAEMYRLNYDADPSRKGLHNSLGIMVNYLYNQQTLRDNQLQYETSLHVPVCADISRWL